MSSRRNSQVVASFDAGFDIVSGSRHLKSETIAHPART
jgi:hypothetical protein